MRSFQRILLVNGNMSGNVISNSQQLDQEVIGCIQAVWVGDTADGVLKLQISNDTVVWSDYQNSFTNVSGAGNFAWNIYDAGYQYIRVVYTATSGEGTLNISWSGKGP